jgi:hypothetical protein
VVYVQPPVAPPLANPTQSSGASPETLTIEEPPPAPVPAPPPAAPAASSVNQNQPVTKKPPKPRTETRVGAEEQQSGAAQAPDTVQAPSLEPAAAAASEEEIKARQSDVRRRIDGFEKNGGGGVGYYSTSADRQILEDARSFVAQSEQALKVHDLLKAQELVEKASLLLDALEQRP